MTHACCPGCRLRFTPAAAAQLAFCPQCAGALVAMPGLEGAVGFRLFKAEDLIRTSLPEAIAVSRPLPKPPSGPDL